MRKGGYMSDDAQYARHNAMLANGEIEPGREHDPNEYISPGEMAYYESVVQEQRHPRDNMFNNNDDRAAAYEAHLREQEMTSDTVYYDEFDGPEPEGDDYMPDELYTEDGEIIDPAPNAFNPTPFLSKVSGQDYLEVKWRLLWLRTDHPNATIDTTCLTHDSQHASFKATVTIPGRGSASGHGSETPGDFRDYYEKAETKALGRALAALGFGTQFSKDYEFGANDGRVVDAPVRPQGIDFGKLPLAGTTRPTGPQNAPQLPPMPAGYNGPSEKQLGWLKSLWKDIDPEELETIASYNDIDLTNLTGGRGGTASKLIDILNDRKRNGPPTF